MKIDLVFLLVLGFVVAYLFVLHKVETMADVSNTDQIKEAVKQIYMADVEAIRNLSNVATKLQAGGLTVPGTMTLTGNMLINNSDQQDKLIVYKNGDTKPPYLFYNKQGTTGLWTGDSATWSIDETGKISANDITTRGPVSAQADISVSNKTNEGGRIRILNELKSGKADITNDWSIWNMTGNYGNKLAFWRYNGDGKNAGPVLELLDDGTVNVTNTLFNKKKHYLFYPEDAIIYQNIFEAVAKGAIVKSGNPGGWNDTSYRENNMWNARPILRIGDKNAFPNGARIKVPDGKNVIWIRLLNERWNTYQIYDSSGKDLGNFAGGYRNLNHIAPDGGSSDGFWNVHAWIYIPVPGPGDYVLCSGNNVHGHGADGWISGLAFSTNPWNLASNSAISYHWKLNGGDALDWETENWNNDQLARIPQKRISSLIVPVVPSGKNKLLYIVEYNNNWQGLSHNSITVENAQIERFRTSWDHPLAVHVNSKYFSRFAAAMIPEEITRNKRWTKIVLECALPQS